MLNVYKKINVLSFLAIPILSLVVSCDKNKVDSAPNYINLPIIEKTLKNYLLDFDKSDNGDFKKNVKVNGGIPSLQITENDFESDVIRFLSASGINLTNNDLKFNYFDKDGKSADFISNFSASVIYENTDKNTLVTNGSLLYYSVESNSSLVIGKTSIIETYVYYQYSAE